MVVNGQYKVEAQKTLRPCLEDMMGIRVLVQKSMNSDRSLITHHPQTRLLPFQPTTPWTTFIKFNLIYIHKSRYNKD